MPPENHSSIEEQAEHLFKSLAEKLAQIPGAEQSGLAADLGQLHELIERQTAAAQSQRPAWAQTVAARQRDVQLRVDLIKLRAAQAAAAAELRDTRLLHDLSMRLVTEENIQVVYQEIVSAAITLSNADAGTVQIVDDSTHELLLLAAQGFDQTMMDHFQRVDVRSNTTCGTALATGVRSFMDFDTPGAEDPDSSLRMHLEAGYHSAQSTPLITRSGRPVGMISTHWRQSGRRPTERELRFLDLLARQAADLIDRKRSEDTLRASEAHIRTSEAKYRSLHEAMDEGFVLTEILLDEMGRPVDIYFHEANPAAKRMLGFDFAGRRFSELFEPDPEWIELWNRVASTGNGERLERFIEPVGKWFNFFLLRIDVDGRPLVANVFQDITGSKRRELNTAFLADVIKEVSRLSTPDDIVRAAGESIKAHFGVPVLTFAEADEAKNQVWGLYYHAKEVFVGETNKQPLNEYISEDLLHEMEAGHVIVVEDVTTDPRFRDRAAAYQRWGIQSQIVAPFSREGQLQFMIAVQCSAPHAWNTDEVELLSELAMRIYPQIERARYQQALQQSRAELAVELADAIQLQQISTQMMHENKPGALYEQLVEAAMRLVHSDMGSIQVLDPQRSQLKLVAWRGFAPESARFWNWVRVDSFSTCGMVLNRGERVIVTDVDDCDFLAATRDLEHYHLSGARAVQSTPLLSRSGRLMGVISTHWREPHQPSERELRLLDMLARQASDLVERAQAEAALRESEELFRTSIESLNESFLIFSAVRQGRKIVDLRFDYVNETVCRLYGRRFEQIVGHTILQLFPEQKTNGLFDQYVQVVETGQPMQQQLEVMSEGLKGRPMIQGVFDLRASKFNDGLIVTANDITDQLRLQAEHQLAIQQREIHHRLAEQREIERQSYARDIHDGPVQTLSSLAFTLQYLKEIYPDEALQNELNGIGESVKEAIQELRDVINELRPPSVIRFGLAKAIQSHIGYLRERYPHITWSIDLVDDERLLPEQTCLAMFRIYQEAVNNIVRHAEANHAWVGYHMADGYAWLEIQDNGRGFSEEYDVVSLTSNQHFGLAGISERVEAINGQLEIETQPNHGTVIKVRIPVQIP